MASTLHIEVDQFLQAMAAEDGQQGRLWERVSCHDAAATLHVPGAAPIPVTMGVVVHQREQPAQLYGGRELAALAVGSAHRGSVRIGHEEHPDSMGRHTRGRQVGQARRSTASTRPAGQWRG